MNPYYPTAGVTRLAGLLCSAGDCVAEPVTCMVVRIDADRLDELK